MSPTEPAATTWATSLIAVHELWDRGFDGCGQLVAVMDGGVDARHAALSGRVAIDIAVGPDGLDVMPASPDRRSDHATAVGSLIAGGTVDGIRLGVAPGASLISVEALGPGESLARLVVGMDEAARAGAGIVCLPLGMRSFHPLLAAAASGLLQHGVLTVASSGNDGPGAIRSPADHAEVLAVGACDRNGRVIDSSGSLVTVAGACLSPDVVAPGADVLAAGPRATRHVSGASFAAACVAGLAALLRHAVPHASAAAVRAAIIDGAQPLHADQRRRSYRGVVDGAQAFDLLCGRTGVRPDLAAVSGAPLRSAAADIQHWVDPSLADALDRMAADRPHAAVIGVGGPSPADAAYQVRAAMEAAGHRSGLRPLAVRCQPFARTAVVRAPAHFLRVLCDTPTVQIASATTVGVGPPARRYRAAPAGRTLEASRHR